MSFSTTTTLGLRADPSFTPPQWCIDQAEELTDDIFLAADQNMDGVLSEDEFRCEASLPPPRVTFLLSNLTPHPLTLPSAQLPSSLAFLTCPP